MLLVLDEATLLLLFEEVRLPLLKDFVLEQVFFVALLTAALEVVMLFAEELGCLHPFVEEFVQETQYTHVVL